MHLFYAPGIEFTKEYELSREESRHTLKVLRLKTGDEVLVTDGKGSMGTAVLLEGDSRICKLKVQKLTLEPEPRNISLHLAVSPTKNPDRLEWLLEKATEIGIERITPIICERSERKEVNIERLERILVSGMKQSMRAWLPQLSAPLKFGDLMKDNHTGKKFIAHCLEGTQMFSAQRFQAGDNLLVLIGPEGDFSKSEIETALNQGFSPLSLGRARLRTETAAMVVCAQVAYLTDAGTHV